MKISQEMRSQMETKHTRSTVDGKHGFDKMVQSQTHQLKQQAVEQLMQEITQQGDKLARFRSFQDLVKFKRMVKSFLEETVSHGLTLKKSRQFSFDGQNRELTIINEIDDKLMTLTEEVMNQEKKTVDLLGIIGEIKGLLINLYM
ncbi:MAG TPA: YaaR family protein [Virgibacillus sp.]|nr:YaaR family protein [Virgibacillus sp.]